MKDTLWLDLETRKLFRVPQMVSGRAAQSFRAHRKQTGHKYIRVTQRFLECVKSTPREPAVVVNW